MPGIPEVQEEEDPYSTGVLGKKLALGGSTRTTANN